MQAQWRTILFWASAIGLVVAATMLYQPAAARTGSLLVWTNNRIYVMDIDTLTLERIAPADPGDLIAPSPGCKGMVDAPCRVLVNNRLYQVEVGGGGSDVTAAQLPLNEGFRWENSAVSWSPDGQHLAFTLRNEKTNEYQLQVVDVTSRQIVLQANDVDPDVAAAWSPGCAEGLNAEICKIGYKKMPAQKGQGGFLATLVGYTPVTQKVEQWSVSPEKLFALQWAGNDMLLYSRPKRHFIYADDHTPAYSMPQGGQLANVSPNGKYTVYYQPFTLEGCSGEADTNNCLHLGVWLESKEREGPFVDLQSGPGRPTRWPQLYPLVVTLC